MPKFFLYSKINRVRNFLAAANWWKKFQMNTVILRFVLLGAVFLVGGIYLTLINTTATRGFEVDELSKKTETLKEENKKLERAVAENSSLTRIQSQSANLGLVTAGQVEYVDNKDKDLAFDN